MAWVVCFGDKSGFTRAPKSTFGTNSFWLKSSVEKCNRVVPLLVERHCQVVILRNQNHDYVIQVSPHLWKQWGLQDLLNLLCPLCSFRLSLSRKLELKIQPSLEKKSTTTKADKKVLLSHLVCTFWGMKNEAKPLFPKTELFIFIHFGFKLPQPETRAKAMDNQEARASVPQKYLALWI